MTMDSEAGSNTSAERGMHGLIGHGNNESSVSEPASLTGLRRSLRSLKWIRVKGAAAIMNLGFLLRLRQSLRSLKWIRVKRAAAIMNLGFLLVFGLITVVLEVKLHEHHWLEGLGIVVAVLVLFLIEWLFHYFQCLHSPNVEEETNGDTQQAVRDERTEEARRVVMLAETSQEKRLLLHWEVAFAFVVGVIFVIPLIRTLTERGSAVGLGLWDVIKLRLDTVKRLVGIVKIIESVFVIWVVVVEEALSLVAIHNSAVSLLSNSGRTSQLLNLLMLQKFMEFQLVPVLTILVVNFVVVVCMGDMSFSVAQLLWVHAVVRLGELGLAEEDPAAEIRMRSLRDNNANSMRGDDDDDVPLPVSNTTWRNLLVRSFYLTAVLLFLHFRGTQWLQKFGIATEEINQTVRFNVLVLCIILSLVSARRTEETNIFEGVLSNGLLLGVVGSTAVLQALLVEFGGTFSSTVKLSWSSWTLCIVVALISWPLDWLFKLCPVLPSNLRFRTLLAASST